MVIVVVAGATVVVVAFAVVGEAVVVVGAACDQCKASEYGSGVSQEFGINTAPRSTPLS